MRSINITRTMVDAYCSIVNDNNTIHDAQHNVVPGMLIASLFATENHDSLIVRDVSLTFKKPVFVGETIDITARMDNMRTKLHTEFYDMAYDVRVEGELRVTITASIFRYLK